MEDVLGMLLDKGKDLLILLISTALDCIESAFDCMTYRKGKSLLPVLLVVLSFIPLTGITSLFELNFIHFADSIVASIFMVIIYSINNITRVQVENSIVFTRETALKVEKKIKKMGGKRK